MEGNRCRYFLTSVYMLAYFYHLFLCYQEGKVSIPFTGLIIPNLCAYPKSEPGFPTSCVGVFVCSVNLV
jgi:hypothetical protein